MSLVTVNGTISRKDAGIISPHEHILIDLRNQFTEFSEVSMKTRSEKRVDISHLDILKRNPYALRDNLILGDEDTAVAELGFLKRSGGRTVVDATSVGIGRDPEAMRRISNTVGIHILVGTGFYTGDTHSEALKSMTVSQIADAMLEEVYNGIGKTGIRPGFIGEIGLSKDISESEMRVLEASGIVQKKTNFALHVHTYPWGTQGLTAVDVLKKQGASVEKIIIDHVDVEIDTAYCVDVMKTGASIEFDDFGKEFYIDSKYRAGFAGGVFERDLNRVKALKELTDKGFASKIFLTCDVCLKTLLHTYGGWGYDHILSNIVPMMCDYCISDKDIATIVEVNPSNIFDV